MKTHFIFDLDDTLTNSYEHNQNLFVETFLPHFPDIDQKLCRDVHYKSRGTAMHLQFEEVVKALKLDIDPHMLVKENEELHIKNVDRLGSFEAAEEMLRLLKENNKTISLCTNRQYGSLRRILDNNNLTHYFEHIVSCLDEGYEKPDPFCLNQIISKYDLPKEEFLYFGDSKTDHDFATNAGIDFIIIDQYMNQKKFFKVIVQAFF